MDFNSKKFEKILGITLAVFFGGILFSCVFSNETTLEERGLYTRLSKKPWTKKEKEFAEVLRKKGCDRVVFRPPTIGIEEPLGKSRYIITLFFNSDKLNRITNNTRDSLELINYNIAQEMCNRVLEDSIVSDISSLSITTTIFLNSRQSASKELVVFNNYLKKELLEKK